MARLLNEEWLHHAKRCAVGAQQRVRHKNERRDNLVVGNTEDRYWAWCQSCKCGAVEMKAHVAVGTVAPRDSISLSRPTDDVAPNSLPAYERDAITGFLARKNMDWMFFGQTPVTWSRSRQRLLLHFPNGLMGRDTTERSEQKWLTYNGQHFLGAEGASANAVIVEDAFSLLKVQYALSAASIDCAVLCSLGTKIHDSLFLHLLKTKQRVVSFYDGDPPGWHGAEANARRLQGADIFGGGSNVTSDCAPIGFDPKDLTIGAIQAHVKGLFAIS